MTPSYVDRIDEVRAAAEAEAAATWAAAAAAEAEAWAAAAEAAEAAHRRQADIVRSMIPCPQLPEAL